MVITNKILYLKWEDFHQLMIMQKIIYKQHGCMGYKQWLSDAEIIAAGSPENAIEGGQYYRCMRIHKEAFDALVQLRAENITDSYSTISSEVADILYYHFTKIRHQKYQKIQSNGMNFNLLHLKS